MLLNESEKLAEGNIRYYICEECFNKRVKETGTPIAWIHLSNFEKLCPECGKEAQVVLNYGSELSEMLYY